MFQIIGKQNLNATVRRLDIRADALVPKMQPGQFVSVMADRFSRQVPMNVYDVDFRRRCLSLVFEEHDVETVKMGNMRINDRVFAVNGPYGMPVPAKKIGSVIFVGEGLGLSSIASLCRSFKQSGNKVIGIAGFEERGSSVLENQLRLNCSKAYVMYKDGMHERRGDVLIPLRKAMAQEQPVRIYAHASFSMMSNISRIAIDAKVSLWINVMGLLDPQPSFSDTDTLLFKGEPYFPARDGVWIDASCADIDMFVKTTDALKEYYQCRKNEAALSASKNVWARLKKFVWG
ncbi:MAG: hypothetical protein HQL22_11155 [Candidatus Omnitrophica bacterium]|nr:hypothetical protein [Candidatus Omnitrophota bacterium]